LFLELAAIFPAWKQAFDGAEGVKIAKRAWMTGMLEDGINSIAQVKAGLKKARQSTNPFMPSVGQFISWCKPDAKEFGLPDSATAWNEILNARRVSEFGESPWIFSHGIILAVRNDDRVDIFNWRLLPVDQSNKKFNPIYDEYLKRAMNGEEFALPVMIENKKNRPVTKAEHKEFAEKHLAGLKAVVK